MTEEEFKQMADRAYYIRGLVINESIYIEKAIEYFIATHYCGETESRDLMVEELLTNEVTFRTKILAFKNIITNNYVDWKYDNSEVIGNLERIARDRNILAHEVLDTSKFGTINFIVTRELNFAKFNRIERNVFNDSYEKEIREIIYNTSTKIMMLVPSFKPMPFPYGDL